MEIKKNTGKSDRLALRRWLELLGKKIFYGLGCLAIFSTLILILLFVIRFLNYQQLTTHHAKCNQN